MLVSDCADVAATMGVDDAHAAFTMAALTIAIATTLGSAETRHKREIFDNI